MAWPIMGLLILAGFWMFGGQATLLTGLGLAIGLAAMLPGLVDLARLPQSRTSKLASPI